MRAQGSLNLAHPESLTKNLNLMETYNFCSRHPTKKILNLPQQCAQSNNKELSNSLTQLRNTPELPKTARLDEEKTKQ